MLAEAKTSLDDLIRKSRVHFYKPIQIAEILHYHRLGLADFSLERLETYRNASKRWRDVVTLRLVGRVSTSSQKYQDNLFDENAIPLPHLLLLAEFNRQHHGMVESYIYHRFEQRLQDVRAAYAYLVDTPNGVFSLNEFLNFYESKPGLKRSIDKAYEIVVYALFTTLVQELNARVSLTLEKPNPEVLADFAKFVAYVLGLAQGETAISVEAKLYRGGVANAADRGLDIVSNYGPAIQVKHLSLDVRLAHDIVDTTAVHDLVIVCQTAEAAIIQSLLNQVGLGIRGIITQEDLALWYELCQTKYATTMGTQVLQNLRREFIQEFPMLQELPTFLAERHYTNDAWLPPFLLVN